MSAKIKVGDRVSRQVFMDDGSEKIYFEHGIDLVADNQKGE
jgi:hypothetical protein